MKLPRALRSWSRTGRFESWLYSVVVHSVRDRQRHFAAERRKVEGFALEPRNDASGSDEALDDLWAAVRR